MWGFAIRAYGTDSLRMFRDEKKAREEYAKTHNCSVFGVVDNGNVSIETRYTPETCLMAAKLVKMAPVPYMGNLAPDCDGDTSLAERNFYRNAASASRNLPA